MSSARKQRVCSMAAKAEPLDPSYPRTSGPVKGIQRRGAARTEATLLLSRPPRGPCSSRNSDTPRASARRYCTADMFEVAAVFSRPERAVCRCESSNVDVWERPWSAYPESGKVERATGEHASASRATRRKPPDIRAQTLHAVSYGSIVFEQAPNRKSSPKMCQSAAGQHFS